jgi:hypothetical protein
MKYEQQIFFVRELRLRRIHESKLTGAERQRIEAWLAQWTCKNNFKAVLAFSLQQATAVLRPEVQKTIATHNFPLEEFVFDLSTLELRLEGGVPRFWLDGFMIGGQGWSDISVA